MSLATMPLPRGGAKYNTIPTASPKRPSGRKTSTSSKKNTTKASKLIDLVDTPDQQWSYMLKIRNRKSNPANAFVSYAMQENSRYYPLVFILLSLAPENRAVSTPIMHQGVKVAEDILMDVGSSHGRGG